MTALRITAIVTLVSFAAGRCPDEGSGTGSEQKPKLFSDDNSMLMSVPCGKQVLVQAAGSDPVDLTALPEIIDDSIVDAINEVTSATQSRLDEAMSIASEATSSAIETIASRATALETWKGETETWQQETEQWQLQTNICAQQGRFRGSDGNCLSGQSCAALETLEQAGTANGVQTRNFTIFPNNRLFGRAISECVPWHNGTRLFGPRTEGQCAEADNGNVEWHYLNNIEPLPCRPVTECTPGQYMVSNPTPFTDGECRPCPANTYQSAQNTTARSCTPATRGCPAGKYSSFAGNASRNRVCSNCPSNSIQLANDFSGSSCTAIQNYGRCAPSSCSASSRYNGAYDCRYAYNEQWSDGGYRAWATRGQGAGAWYRMNFNGNYYINRMQFMQRGCGCEWFRQVRLEFSNGQTRTFELQRTGGRRTYNFDWVGPVDRVTIRFLSQWSRVNNGANEIQFDGFRA